MKVTSFICDRCETKLSSRWFNVNVKPHNEFWMGPCASAPDLCDDCTKEFWKWINGEKENDVHSGS